MQLLLLSIASHLLLLLHLPPDVRTRVEHVGKTTNLPTVTKLYHAGCVQVEQWEQKPLHLLVNRKALGNIRFEELNTPYIKPLSYNFPAVDMIRMPTEMIQITYNMNHEPLKCKHILSYLKVSRERQSIVFASLMMILYHLPCQIHDR